MDKAPTPVSSLTALTIVDPDGKKHYLGCVFKHRNPIVQAILGTPLRWQLEFNTARHNRRMEKLTCKN